VKYEAMVDQAPTPVVTLLGSFLVGSITSGFLTEKTEA
jgi:hypothetical protein